MARRVFVLFLVSLCAFFCSCGRRSQRNIAVLYCSYKDDYINSVRSELDRAFADNDNIKFQNYSADWDGIVQLGQVREAIESGADMLIVNLADVSSAESSMDIADLASESDVPIIFFNRPVAEEMLASHPKSVIVSIDYKEAGRIQGGMAGKYLLDNYELVDLNNDGKISYVMYAGEAGSIDAQSRAEYCIDTIDSILAKEGKPAIEFYDNSVNVSYVMDESGKWSSDFAKANMKEILKKHTNKVGNMPELIISGNDAMALGAIEALKEYGYNTGKGNRSIPVFGIDATVSAQNAIYSGIMTGTVYQDSMAMAEAIITVSENMLGGKQKFNNINESIIEGNHKINIPLKEYRGRKNM